MVVFLERTLTLKQFPHSHGMWMFKGIFFATLTFLKRTDTLSTNAEVQRPFRHASVF